MTQPSVLFLVPQSHECWSFFFLSLSLFDTIFQVCFHVRCAHLTEWRHMLIHTGVWGARLGFSQASNKRPSWRVRRITSKPKPLQVTMSSPVLPWCVTGLLFSASLLPCSAFRSDSSWLIQAAYHSDPLTGWLKTWCLTVGWRRRSGWYQTLVCMWAPALWRISTAVVQYWSTFCGMFKSDLRGT